MGAVHTNLHSWNPKLMYEQTKDFIFTSIHSSLVMLSGFFHIYVSDYIYIYIHPYHLSIVIYEIALISTLDRQKSNYRRSNISAFWYTAEFYIYYYNRHSQSLKILAHYTFEKVM